MSAVATAPAGPVTPEVGRVRFGSTLTGTGRMIRFILRRDRVRMLVWTLSICAFYAYFAVALGAMGSDVLAARGAAMTLPAGIVMAGPGYGIEDYTVGVAIANEGITWVVLCLAIMSVVHVVRHTRTEEETGRSELVRAAVVGRHAPAVAAVVTLFALNLFIAIVSAGALTGASGGDLGFADSLALTIGSGLSGMVFGVLALVACQVFEGGGVGIAVGLLAFLGAWVVRSIGDVLNMAEGGGYIVSWFSAIGWAQEMRPFVDLRWWPALLSIAAIVVLLSFAAILASRRDFGGGMVATRPGRPDAKPSLAGPTAMAWRQQWFVFVLCFVLLGLMWFGTGTLVPTIIEMGATAIEENAFMAAMMGDDGSGFLNVMILFASLCVAAYAIVLGARPKAEEGTGRAEIVLARPRSRAEWLGANVAITGLCTIALMAASSYPLWLGMMAVDMDDFTLSEHTEIFWTYSVALLVFLALVVALYGWFPRATGWAWLLLAYTFLAGMFQQIFDFPEWAQGLSPFYWIPVPYAGESPEPSHMIGLSVIAVVLFGLAFLGFRRRDVPAV